MKGLCHSCLTSNVELHIDKKRIICAECLDFGEHVVASPTTRPDEFPDLIVPTEQKRCDIIEDYTEKMYEKLKNSLIDGEPDK